MNAADLKRLLGHVESALKVYADSSHHTSADKGVRHMLETLRTRIVLDLEKTRADKPSSK